MAYIYKITNDINDKVYIGKTYFEIEKRFQEHCRDSIKRRCEKRPLYSAMRKYGIEHFRVSLVEETEFPEQREIFWIEYYDSYNSGYNATTGGDGSARFSHDDIKNALLENLCTAQIAELFGCSSYTVRNIAKEYGIDVINKANDKMKETLGKPVEQYSLDGKYLTTFDSSADAARWCIDNFDDITTVAVARASISQAASGKRKQYHGFIWKHTQ